MRAVLTLQVRPEPSGGWALQLTRLGQAPVAGELGGPAVDALTGSLRELLRPPSIVVPGQVTRREANEEAAGRALAQVLTAPGFAEPLHQAIGEGLGALVLDAEHPAAHALPWELICATPSALPLEEATGAVVARLSVGSPARTSAPASRLRVLAWCAQPEDPTLRRVSSALRALCERLGVALVPLAPDLAGGLPEPEPDTVDLLHLLCHGERAEGALRLRLPGADGTSGSLSGLLDGPVDRLGLVVVGVCQGGAVSPHRLNDLSGRLLRRGVTACLTPAEPVRDEALISIMEGLLPKLVAGADLNAAVLAARRAVRALRSPHPDSRPYTVQLQVSDLGRLSGAPFLRAPHGLPGWPRVDAALNAWLLRAKDRAEALGLGYLGVEHLILAAEPGDGGLLHRAAVRALAAAQLPLSRLLGGLSERAPTPGGLRLSPRLAALGPRLPEGADADALWALLLSEPHPGLGLLAPQLTLPGQELNVSAQSLSQDAAEARPAEALELVFGPEDGRRISPRPGEVLGREKPGTSAAHPLYVGQAAIDRLLRSDHVTWRGPGQVLLRSSMVPTASGLPRPARGLTPLRDGELLWLTESTWIAGRA
ncbi:CHAT domain-containing protein [Myxococcota bacterium]|nr:CHAT domain-containing protein [Myxococcota bacterium]